MPSAPEIIADGSMTSVGNGGNETYARDPADWRIRVSGSSVPPNVRNIGRERRRRPETVGPSSSTTVSTLAQSSPVSGGVIVRGAVQPGVRLIDEVRGGRLRGDAVPRDRAVSDESDHEQGGVQAHATTLERLGATW